MSYIRRENDILHVGLLILRVGIGMTIFFHGLPKMMGGMETWMQLGGTMSLLGINFAPPFWGFMAAFAETVGGILFAVGLFFRPAALLLIGTMTMALIMHFSKGDDFMRYGHALDLFIVFAATFISGSGKYALDTKFFKR